MSSDPEKISISGTVTWHDTNARITRAVIRAAPEEGKVRLTETNDDGDFTFHNLEPGMWALEAMHHEARPGGPQEMNLQEDDAHFDFKLYRQMGTADASAGRRFFMVLCGLLALLVIAHVVLHILLHEDVAEGLFWDQEPWSYLEVVFWAITGTLVHLIIRTGSYLRWGHFYREGIVMHIAQMITIPLLALVLVWLLSTVELTVTFVGDNNLQLDLSDPRLLAAVSFLIGSRPWAVWDVLQETAGKITGRQVSHPEAAT